MILFRILRIIIRVGHIVGLIIKYYILFTLCDFICFIFDKIVNGSKGKFVVHTFAQKTRLCVERLFPTGIKLGQWLSMRPEFASNEMIKELNKLQDTLPPISFKTIKKIIKRELKKDYNEVFSSFVKDPLSTASIAQVHKAGIMINGDEEKKELTVVVKIQRLKLKKLIDIDMHILSFLFIIIGYFSPSLPIAALRDMLVEFRRYLYQEIDFINEAQNMEHMTVDMKNFPYIKIPKVYWDRDISGRGTDSQVLTTTNVLTMEWLDGLKPKYDELKQYGKRNLCRKILCNRGADAIFAQIFEYGFFHCDPHPGNILALEGNVVGFIDLGIIGKFDMKLKNNVIDLFYYIIKRNIDGVQQVLLNLANIYTPINEHGFSADCQELVHRMHYIASGRIDFSNVIYSLNNLIYTNKLSLPPTFLFMIKAILTIEGVARTLDPEFDWRKHMEPILKKLLRERISCKKVTRDLKDTILESLLLLPKIPRKLSNFLDLVPESGDDPLTMLGKSFRMLSISLIIAALLITSVLLNVDKTYIIIMVIVAIGFLWRMFRRLE